MFELSVYTNINRQLHKKNQRQNSIIEFKLLGEVLFSLESDGLYLMWGSTYICCHVHENANKNDKRL